MMKNILLFIGGMLLSTLISAEVIERKVAVDALDMEKFNSQLENRLNRDIFAYLGHDRFIVQIHVNLQKIQQWEISERVSYEPVVEEKPAEPVTQSTPPAAESNKPLSGQDETLQQMELDIEDEFQQGSTQEDNISLPGMPFSSAEVQGTQKSISKKSSTKESRQQKVIQQARQKQSPPATAPVLTKKVEKQKRLLDEQIHVQKLAIKIVLDESISPEQEAFIRSLVAEKARLSIIRGDTLDIVRTRFPAQEQEEKQQEQQLKEAQAQEPATTLEPEEEKPFYDMEQLRKNWPLWLAVAVFILLLVWLLRRQSGHNVTEATPVVTDTEDNKVSELEQLFNRLNIKKEIIKDVDQSAYREEMVYFAATEPEIFQSLLSSWSNSENTAERQKAALVHLLFGETLFNSLLGKKIPLDKQLELAEAAKSIKEESSAEEIREQSQQIYQAFVQSSIRHSVSENKQQPFSFLDKLDNDQIKYLLDQEDIRVKAIILSQLDASRSAAILKDMPAEQRTEIALEISRFEKMPIVTFRDIARRLAKKALDVPSFSNISVDGIDLLINMLDSMDSASEAALLKALHNDNPDLYYQIRKIYIAFEDIVKLPDLAIKNIIAETDREKVALALYDMDDAFVNKVLSVLLERPRLMLKQLVDALSQADISEVQAARQEISRRARAMLKAGMIERPE